MGQLKSQYNWTGRDINGVILGSPVEIDGFYVWDGAVMDGTIDVDGNIVVETVIESVVGDFVGIPEVEEAIILKPDEQ